MTKLSKEAIAYFKTKDRQDDIIYEWCQYLVRCDAQSKRRRREQIEILRQEIAQSLTKTYDDTAELVKSIPLDKDFVVPHATCKNGILKLNLKCVGGNLISWVRRVPAVSDNLTDYPEILQRLLVYDILKDLKLMEMSRKHQSS
jgi:hypothetical protein